MLGGNKVRAFYQCNLTAGECGIPVIDRHSIAVALNRVLSDQERKIYAKGRRYDAIAKAYIEVAEKLQVPVANLQAIVWVSWRKKKGMAD